MKRILITIIILQFALMTGPAFAKSVGVFTAVSGEVEIKSFFEDKGRAARPGGYVNVSDVISSRKNSRAEIAFHDGNIIRIASGTRLKVAEYIMKGRESSEVIKLFYGRIRNIVKTVFERDFRNKKGRYEVHMPTAICGVRGTDFFAFHEDRKSGATFVSGRGYGFSVNAPEDIVTVGAGETMTAEDLNEPPSVGPANVSNIERFKKETQTPNKETAAVKKDKEKKAGVKTANSKPGSVIQGRQPSKDKVSSKGVRTSARYKSEEKNSDDKTSSSGATAAGQGTSGAGSAGSADTGTGSSSSSGSGSSSNAGGHGSSGGQGNGCGNGDSGGKGKDGGNGNGGGKK